MIYNKWDVGTNGCKTAICSVRPMIFSSQGGRMIKEEFYFDSRDGENRIHAVRYTPDDGNVKGIVQIVHGMAE